MSERERSSGWRGWLAPAGVGVALAVAVAACTASTASTTSAAGASGSAAAGSPAGSPAAAAPVGGAAGALQASYEQVIKRALPTVVQITTSGGLGSGVIYDKRGDIVTNAHVVGTSRSFQVTLATGRSALNATLVGVYPPDDLAVIRLTNPPASLTAASFANSSTLQPGQIVLALGNPLGLSGSVTEGIVSATGRTVSEPQSADSPGATIADAIQTSAAINPGNSGGALVDLSGQVVGIPTLAATDPQLGGGAAPGIGFAIPSNTVTSIAGQLVKTGSVSASQRAALAVTVRSVLDLGGQPAGVGVVAVTAGGAAAKAGIKVGDLITAVNGTPTPDTTTLSQVLAQLKPGDRAAVNILHADGSTATVTVTLDQLH